MKANNLNADSPLSPAYDDGALALATGEAGLWFQGNWAFPLLKEINPDGDYGILPVPLDNDASRPGNTSISVGVPMYYAIDASQTTPDEQAGALDFITWLFLTEAGQKHSVGEMEFIPVYEDATIQPNKQSVPDGSELCCTGQVLGLGQYVLPCRRLSGDGRITAEIPCRCD